MITIIAYSIFAYIFYGGMLFEEYEQEDNEINIHWDGFLLLIFAPLTLPFILGYNYSRTLNR